MRFSLEILGPSGFVLSEDSGFWRLDTVHHCHRTDDSLGRRSNLSLLPPFQLTGKGPCGLRGRLLSNCLHLANSCQPHSTPRCSSICLAHICSLARACHSQSLISGRFRARLCWNKCRFWTVPGILSRTSHPMTWDRMVTYEAQDTLCLRPVRLWLRTSSALVP